MATSAILPLSSDYTLVRYGIPVAIGIISLIIWAIKEKTRSGSLSEVLSKACQDNKERLECGYPSLGLALFTLMPIAFGACMLIVATIMTFVDRGLSFLPILCLLGAAALIYDFILLKNVRRAGVYLLGIFCIGLIVTTGAISMDFIWAGLVISAVMMAVPIWRFKYFD